jgi:capsid protein
MSLCFYPIETEQYLGLPWLTPVLPQIWDDQQLFDDKLKQSRIGARLGVKISQHDVGAVTDLLATDSSSGDEYFELDFQGFYGGKDKPEPISITDPIKDTFKALVDMTMQRVAIGLGFSYQLFTSDLSGANFSSARMNTINDSLGFRTLYKWFVKARCQRRWEQFVYSEVLTGRLSDLGVTMAEYQRDPWTFNQCFHLPMDGQEWVDPLKDIQATVLAYKTGQITYQEICSRTGKHWQSVLKQLEIERKEFESRGLQNLLPENIDKKEPVNNEQNGVNQNENN